MKTTRSLRSLGLGAALVAVSAVFGAACSATDGAPPDASAEEDLRRRHHDAGSLLADAGSEASPQEDGGVVSTGDSGSIGASDAAIDPSPPGADPCANDADGALPTGPVYFVAPDGAGSGTSWTAAWRNVTSIAWSSIGPGSTICIAGGTYGDLSIETNGTASARVCIKRAVANDPQCGQNTPGWKGAYDAQVVVTSISVPSGSGSYVTVDGRVPYGGLKVDDRSTGESYAVNLAHSTANYFRLFDVDVAGVATRSTNFTGDGRCFYDIAESVTHGLHIAYSQFHGKPTLFLTSGQQDVIFEHNKLFDSVVGNPAEEHPNVWASLENEVNVVWRYNEVWNWMAEGIMMCFTGSGCVPNRDWYVYGNVWHGTGTTDTCRVIEAQYDTLGAIYFYNNTFANIWAVTGSHGNGGSFSGGIATNNLLWNAPVDWTGWGIGDNGNMAAGVDPFVDSANGNYHLRSGSAPVDTGKPISPANGHAFDVDGDGHVRGADGHWDMGAFELQ